MPPLLAHTVHHSVHGPPRPQQFDHVRRGQRPRSRAVRRASSSLSVGTVVAGAHRAVRASEGRRMRRAGLALLCARCSPASAAAQTPARTDSAPPARRSTGVGPGRRSAARARRALTGRSFTARVVMRPFVAGETVDAPGLPRQPQDPGQGADAEVGRRRHGGRGDAEGQVGQARPAAAQGLAQGDARCSTAAREDGPRRRRAPERRPRRAAGRRCGCCRRSSRRMHYVVPRIGRLRRGHRPRGDGLAQGRRAVAHVRSPPRTSSTALLAGRGHVQGPPPRRRPPRRGAAELAGAGADQRRQGRADLPHLLGRAGDADRPRQVPRLPEDAGHQRQGHGATRATSSAATRSTATRRCRRTTPATAACACRCRTRARSTTGCGSATSSGSSRRSRPTSRVEHRVHPAGGVGRAHAVRAAALAQDALDLLERVLAVEVARVRAGERERVRADLADRPQRAAPPDRRVDAVARGAERGLLERLGRRRDLLRRRRRRRRRARGPARRARRRCSSRLCASIARTSTVPSFGLGRRSHHRYV